MGQMEQLEVYVPLPTRSAIGQSTYVLTTEYIKVYPCPAAPLVLRYPEFHRHPQSLIRQSNIVDGCEENESEPVRINNNAPIHTQPSRNGIR